MLTPAARDFIREHGITLIYEDSALEGQPEVEVSSVPESVKAVNQLPDAAESVGEPYKAMPMAAVPQGAEPQTAVCQWRDRRSSQREA